MHFYIVQQNSDVNKDLKYVHYVKLWINFVER
jgi:hypothetical protein